MDHTFLKENMMGPNAWRITEELTTSLPLQAGMRVLDLGCGRGISTICLIEKFGVEVVAVDLWTPPTENFERFQRMRVDRSAIPLRLDAQQLPFAEGFFDAVVSVDAYHYFGPDEAYFPNVLRPILKPDAIVAIAVPGLKAEYGDNLPEEMLPYWNDDILATVHSIGWWEPRFRPHLNSLKLAEMACFDKAWDDWLACDNPYAIEDRKMMATDGGRYMNLIKITGRCR